MPDSGAVYQPTTVGYSYDTGGGGSFLGAGAAFRRKVTSRKWVEWALLAVALLAFLSGLLTTVINLVPNNSCPDIQHYKNDQTMVASNTTSGESQTENCTSDSGRAAVAVGAVLTLVGLLLGFAWVWLRFFHRNKSPRNGTSGAGGQMLGGLNPSTDLLVGSPSQYGPVLTELPSQLKQSGDHREAAAPLSDQEEETHTLMQEPPPPSSAIGSIGTNNQIPG